MVALSLCAALSACGSLAKGGSGAVTDVAGAADDRGLSVPGSAGDAGAVVGPDGKVVPGAGRNAAAGGGAGGTGSGTGLGTGGASTAGASNGAPGAPVAGNAPIKLGITYPDTTAIATAFGQESHDAAGFLTKIVNYINKTGGIAGRKIEPVYHKFGIEEDMSTAGQRACTALTQDKKVDFVYNGGIGGETLPACLAKAGVAMLDSPGALDSVGEQRIRNRLAPSSMRLDREMLGILNIFAAAGQIKSGDTLGVLVEDCDWGNRIFTNVIDPRAKQLGLKVVKGTFRCVQNLVTDLGPATNDVQREALRFGTTGVNRVLFLTGGQAFIVSRFTETASQQRYYPKYFVGSSAYPYNNTREGAIVKIAEDARPNIMGAGTVPLLDVGLNAQPANAQQIAAQKRCKAADPDEGLTAGEDDPEQKPFNRSTFLGVCDGFYAIKALLEANGVRYSVTDVVRGYHTALSGDRTASANLGGGFFAAAPTRLDGVGRLRPFAWDAKKNTFLYTGAPVQIP
jgi:ABC-type branched-subunit amino acid transport system substrate-binding protein